MTLIWGHAEVYQVKPQFLRTEKLKTSKELLAWTKTLLENVKVLSELKE